MSKSTNNSNTKKVKYQMELPEVFTQNTFYWKPAMNSSLRRSSEAKKIDIVEAFFRMTGFTNIERFSNEINGTLLSNLGEIRVNFYYSESAKNVYKTLTIHLDDVKKNIRCLKKAIPLQKFRNDQIDEILEE